MFPKGFDAQVLFSVSEEIEGPHFREVDFSGAVFHSTASFRNAAFSERVEFK
ncbi:MAG: pentapeptide repeat-containing protein [Acidobacteria bacterium]|nr:pentapeptide repeat-containing protein [Acidobacteriota bacterium]